MRQDSVVILTRKEWLTIRNAMHKAIPGLVQEIEEISELIQDIDDTRHRRTTLQLMIDNYKHAVSVFETFLDDMR